MQQQPQAQPTPKPKKKIRVPRVVNGVEQMVEIEVDADAGPGWGPNDKHRLLNQRITRVDGAAESDWRRALHVRSAPARHASRAHSSLPARPRARHKAR